MIALLPVLYYPRKYISPLCQRFSGAPVSFLHPALCPGRQIGMDSIKGIYLAFWIPVGFRPLEELERHWSI